MKEKMFSLKINALLNGLRQICAIIFPLITFSHVAKTLGKEAYGDYSFTLSVINYFILIAGVGINTYSIREGIQYKRSEKDFNKFCSEIFSINVYSSIIALTTLVAVIFISDRLKQMFTLLFIESFSIVLILIGTDWINNIMEDYLYLTIRYIIIQVVTMIITFLTITNEKDIYTYAIISVVAMYGGNLINIRHIRKKVKVSFNTNINKRHVMPLVILFINSIAITIYVNSDITMLGFLSSRQTVGEYSFSSKLYNSAKQVINAFVIVTLPRIASVINDRTRFNNYIKKIFHGILLILLPAVLLMFILRKEIIIFLGGISYTNSSTIFGILCLAIVFAILSSLISNDILIVNRQDKKCLISTLISAGTNITLNFIFIPYFSMYATAVTTVIAEASSFIIQFRYSKKYFDYRVLDLKKVIPCIVGNIILCCIAIIVRNWSRVVMMGYLPSILLTSMCAVLIYGGTLILCKDEVVIDFLSLFKLRLYNYFVKR